MKTTKKARSSKFGNKVSALYRSKLEQTCASLLAEHSVPFFYERIKLNLIDSFKFSSVERVGKTFKAVESVRSMSYTPDFVGSHWVIETKGMKTPDFLIKWKLFKNYLLTHQLTPLLFMPTNKKEILTSIEHILDTEESARCKRFNAWLHTNIIDNDNRRRVQNN